MVDDCAAGSWLWLYCYYAHRLYSFLAGDQTTLYPDIADPDADRVQKHSGVFRLPGIGKIQLPETSQRAKSGTLECSPLCRMEAEQQPRQPGTAEDDGPDKRTGGRRAVHA